MQKHRSHRARVSDIHASLISMDHRSRKTLARSFSSDINHERMISCRRYSSESKNCYRWEKFRRSRQCVVKNHFERKRKTSFRDEVFFLRYTFFVIVTIFNE